MRHIPTGRRRISRRTRYRGAAVLLAAPLALAAAAACEPVTSPGAGPGPGAPSASASAPAGRPVPTPTGGSPATPAASVGTSPTAVLTSAAPSPTGGPSPTAVPAVPPGSGGNPLAAAPFYDASDTQADTVVAGLRASRPADAALLDKIAKTATGFWVGDWYPTGSVRGTVAGYVARARAAGATPVLVVYAIPGRDCGGYSAGGAGSPAEYRSWLGQVAAGLDGGRVAVVLEPDALAGLDCLSPADAQARYDLIRNAGTALTAAGAAVYLDVGHPNWLSVTEAARRLRLAGVGGVRGFALNTSNFVATTSALAYGDAIVTQLGTGAHFVVDTSRNGLGPAPGDQWCNPAGRALGLRPTTVTGDPDADALLWVKAPGESDGTCNGGPQAGTFWVDYALGLASRAGW